MPLHSEDEWWYCPQTPIGFGATQNVKCLNTEIVTVFYLDTHLEIHTLGTAKPNPECKSCEDRVECLLRQNRVYICPYHEPFNECPADPGSHPGEFTLYDDSKPEEGGYGGPYGCPMWCRSALFDGAYPFPV